MENLGGFVVFIQVAETRSFVAAGRALGLSASAIGKRIARLEARLNVRLFHRSTRSITLTAEGARFLERCRRVIAEIDAAEQELTQSTEAPRGRLRVSLPTIGTLLLPVLADFMAAYPEIELDIDFSDRIVDVVDEGFDAVLRTGRPTDSRLSSRLLGHFRQHLVASPDYLERHGAPRTPADLVQHRCLHYRFPSSGKLEIWPLRTPRSGTPPEVPVSMVSNNAETRQCFAMRGLGIACLPEFFVREALEAGTLRTVLAEHVVSRTPFYVLWPSGRHPAPKQRAFVDYMVEHLRL
ncbi:LysR family transcriptional regulator [Burkholderia contaminans]|uniref:LysR family transcriptional regulator n=1 Tax=Burkholderia contaminans TaxID=488447 RepID=UPI001CF46A66|nr:LysR family transcriptional regulator [Burkholderia contaminans]MCA7914821.1 LysR family transcriptional regulator [Burkholderia contaminans]UUX36632.1 LysR family transcriptional regulator [Burkholderia contaminans]